MKFTIFKHNLALQTHGLTCLVFEWKALEKWKMDPGHPVGYLKNCKQTAEKCLWNSSIWFVKITD